MVSGCISESELRRALNHLYNPAYLRQSPLVRALGLGDDPNAPQSFRRIILDAIEALRPAPGTPPSSPNYRFYQVLISRYIQGMTQDEVAAHLDLSPRQLRREQTLAINLLGEYLRERFGIGDSLKTIRGEEEALAQLRDSSMVLDEMEWLSDALPGRWANVYACLRRAVELAEGLAREHQVRMCVDVQESVPPVSVAPMVLEQAILTLLTAAVRAVEGGQIVLTAGEDADGVSVRLLASSDVSGAGIVHTWDVAAVEVSRDLLAVYGGKSAVSADASSLGAYLYLPVAQPFLVLAIEDNPHTLEVWQRYLEGTRLRLLGVTVPQEALNLAIDLHPSVMILDVMMPGVDGWKLLGLLRNHPATSHIPIIVCTVLPQRDLAFSLGAADFIRKPATRGEFLAALDRQIKSARP